MKKDRIIPIILSLFLILLVFAGTASAGDIDDNMELSSSSDLDEIVGVNDDMNNYEMEATSSDANDMKDASTDKETDCETLSTDPGNYSGLAEEIAPGGHIELKHDYYTYDSGSTITINVDGTVIDGNGAVIDMAGSNIRALLVNAPGVSIINLTIKNANFNTMVLPFTLTLLDL